MVCKKQVCGLVVVAVIVACMLPTAALAQDGIAAPDEDDVHVLLPVVRQVPAEQLEGSASVAVTDGGNLIRNGEFHWGTEEWNFFSNGSAQLSWYPMVVYTTWARVEIAQPGSNTQMFQSGIPLKPNTNYMLNFWAASTNGRDMGVLVHKHGAPYTNYGLNTSANLEPFDENFTYPEAWTYFSFPFTTSGFAEPVADGRLRFWFSDYARAGDVYLLDGVTLREVNGENQPPVAQDDSYQVGQGGDLVIEAPGVLANDYDPDGNWVEVQRIVDEPDHGNAFITSSGRLSYSPDTGFVGEDTLRYVISDGADISNEATVRIKVSALADENIIRNGTFEDATRSWQLYASAGGNLGTACAEGGCRCRVAFFGRGDNVQLYQTNLVLEPHTRYRLSLDAWSPTGRDFQVYLHKHDSPYTNYGLARTVTLDPETWTDVVLEFETANFNQTVTDARIRFWFAWLAEAGDIYEFDNIELRRVGS